MSIASSPTLSMSLPAPARTLDYPAIERERRDARIVEWVEQLKPSHPLEHWLVGRAASVSLTIERLELTEAEERQTEFVRAAHCWEADRNIEAEELALKLHKTPGAISRKLQSFKQGAQWLLDRWTALRMCLDLKNDWNDDQRSLALDLMGVSQLERTGISIVDLPPGRGAEHQIPLRQEFANSQIQILSREIDGPLSQVDKQEHRQTILGHSPARPGSALASIRREIIAATRQLRWALDTFHKVRNNHFAVVEPSGEPKPSTPIDEAPHEESPEQSEPNFLKEMTSTSLAITPVSGQPPRNRHSRRSLASNLRRRRA